MNSKRAGDFSNTRNENEREQATARVVGVQLSPTVSVEYDVTYSTLRGGTQHTPVRVLFPDEVRAMLETSTWSKGATILEAISELGAAYVGRLDAAGLLGASVVGPSPTSVFHIPLSDLRESFKRSPSAA